jgi:tripartite-type tricarboxylate transporter receptor subunit TctC
MKRRALAALAVLAASVFTLPALAQERTMKIVVGFPPGGSADVIARLLAEKLRVSLGQNVIVDNKPGAGGRVALNEVKRAAPDGQTLILSPSGALVIQPWLYSNLGYDPIKDFTAISRVSTFDFAVTAGPGAPAGDIKSVLAWMKANPSKANYATSGAGTVPHFAGQLLAQAAGVPMTHIAYKGGAPAAQDLIGGQVPLMVDTASETIEHHKSGKVRILAVTGETRTKALPDVPTLKEAGINISADAYFGLYGPAGMAPEVVARIDRAVADAMRDPVIQEKVYGFGLVPNHASAADLAATQAAHLKRWEAPIKASGFKAE